MATVNIPIPQRFFRDMRQFMANVQRMQQLVSQFQYSVQNQLSVNQLFQAHQATKNRFQRLLQIFRKLSASLQGSIAAIMRVMGTAGQAFLRVLSIAADLLGPIIGATVSTVTLIGGIAISAATGAARFMKWFWDKMVGLGDAMLQDFLMASGSFSSIGGLRAFRSTFGAYVDTQNLLSNMVQARGWQGGRPDIALQVLGINRFSDTTDMMAQVTIAAAQFMKRQQAGTEMKMATVFSLTSLLNPEELIRLREISDEELQALKKMYDDYRPLMEVSSKATHGWMEFSKIVQLTGVRIQTVIVEELAKSDSPLVQGLKDLSEQLTKFIRVFIRSPLTKTIVAELSKQLDRFSKWIGSPEFQQDIEKLIGFIKRIWKLLKEAVDILSDVVDRFTRAHAPITAPAKYPGRVGLARRVGMPIPTRARGRVVPGRVPPSITGGGREPEAAPAGGYPAVSAKGFGPNQFIKGMMDRGWSKEAASMMAGNVSEESGFNTGTVGDAGTSFGLAQWHNERARSLKNYAQSQGKDWRDPNVQMDFLDREFRQRYGSNVVKSTDMTALEPMGKRFEGYATNTYGKRVQAGRGFYEKYKEPAGTEKATPSDRPAATSTRVTNKAQAYDVQSKLEKEIAGSSLDGYVPPDGERYGIKTGSPKEWAGLMTQMAQQESSMNPKAGGDYGRFGAAGAGGAGSIGLFQLSPADAQTYNLRDKPFTVEELEDPDFNIKQAVQIAGQRARAGGIGDPKQGMAAYWAGSRGYLAQGKVNATPVSTPSEGGAIAPRGYFPPHAYERRPSESGEFNYAATGALGRPGENLTTIRLKDGQELTVNKAGAQRYEGFFNEMIDRGYPVDVSGGYNFRSKRGGGGLSMHAYGAAVDINVDRNRMGGNTTDLPADVEDVAWKHGLSWGGRFGDPMHFEIMSPEAWEHKKQLLKEQGKPFTADDTGSGVVHGPYAKVPAWPTDIDQRWSAVPKSDDNAKPEKHPEADNDNHPIDKLKVTNHSDMDIGHSDSGSDNADMDDQVAAAGVQ